MPKHTLSKNVYPENVSSVVRYIITSQTNIKV